MEFGRITMNVLWILARWPICNRKATQICTNMNSSTKKYKHRKENFRRNAISGAEMIEFGAKRWTSYRVLLVDPFPIEKLHKFAWIWILVQKRNKHRNKNFWKSIISEAETIECGRLMMNLLWSPTHWSISNRKVAHINTSAKTKIFKKMPFRRPKR